MDWTRSGDDLFLVLEPGEEIHTSIRALAVERDLKAAAITSGIGRTRMNVHGYMDETHTYHRWTQEGPCELVTLQGNLARHEDGSPFTHIHATFSDNNNVVHAGHMFEATVEVVAEIHLRIMSKAIMTRCPIEDSEFVALKFD
jgi:predicted DNA-binding protein with PD1-like motif